MGRALQTTKEAETTLVAEFGKHLPPAPGAMRWLVRHDGIAVLQQGWTSPSYPGVFWLDVPTDLEGG